MNETIQNVNINIGRDSMKITWRTFTNIGIAKQIKEEKKISKIKIWNGKIIKTHPINQDLIHLYLDAI